MYDERLNFSQIIPVEQKVTAIRQFFHKLKNIMGSQLLQMDKSQDQWFEEEILRKWGSDYKMIRG